MIKGKDTELANDCFKHLEQLLNENEQLKKDMAKLLVLSKLLTFSNKYEITIQFWPDQTTVFIAKDGVELIDFGGDYYFVIEKSLEYLNRINP